MPSSGSVEPRHIQVPFHQHLPKTEVVCAKVRGISAADKTVHLENMDGDAWDLKYDILVVALGGVVKIFPTPGIAEHAIGLKSVEEAVHIRNKIITNFNRVSSMYPDNPNRQRLLTFVVVGDYTATSEFAHPRALFEEYAVPAPVAQEKDKAV